jgi:hypothetical protein
MFLWQVHAYIIHYLRKQIPYLLGRSDKQKRLLERLESEFVACARRYNLPLGDFPDVHQYRKMLSEVKDISDFKRLDKKMIAEMDNVLSHDIPLLLQKALRYPAKSSSNIGALGSELLRNLAPTDSSITHPANSISNTIGSD